VAFALFVQELKDLHADSGVERVHFVGFTIGDSPWDAGQPPLLNFQGRVRERQRLLWGELRRDEIRKLLNEVVEFMVPAGPCERSPFLSKP
jgi:hypothetical protein